MTAVATDSAKKESGHLVRGLGLLDATMIVIGLDDRLGHLHHFGRVGPAGRSARLAAARVGAGGLLTITGALCCAELAAMMPRAGGQYVFLREAYGRPSGSFSAGRFSSSSKPARSPRSRSRSPNSWGPRPGDLRPTNYLVAPIILGRLRGQPVDAATRRVTADPRPDLGQHPD